MEEEVLVVFFFFLVYFNSKPFKSVFPSCSLLESPKMLPGLLANCGIKVRDPLFHEGYPSPLRLPKVPETSRQEVLRNPTSIARIVVAKTVTSGCSACVLPLTQGMSGGSDPGCLVGQAGHPRHCVCYESLLIPDTLGLLHRQLRASSFQGLYPNFAFFLK